MKIQGKRIASALLAVLIFGMGGCVLVPDKQWSLQEGPDAPLSTEKGSQILVIEIDEHGKFFDRRQLDRMKDWVSKDESDPVVVFVHGWHHNTQPGDENLDTFRQFLPQIEAKTGSRVKGIYVGWRGDSLDPIIPMPEALGDFPTILGRKKASETVGNGALKEVVHHLASYGEARNVVMIGHSLGGSALYYAAKDLIAKPLNDHMEVILLNPALGSREVGKTSSNAPQLSGLIGEAAYGSDAYASTAGLESTKSVASTMAPMAPMALLAHSNRRLLVFQASGDSAVGFFFKFTGNGKPIGFDEKLITHDSCAEDLSACDVQAGGEMLQSPLVGDLEVSPDGCLYKLAQGKFFIKVRDDDPATGCVDANNSPVWVVAGHRSVSANHNDIMNPIQADALSSLIAFRLKQPTRPIAR